MQSADILADTLRLIESVGAPLIALGTFVMDHSVVAVGTVVMVVVIIAVAKSLLRSTAKVILFVLLPIFVIGFIAYVWYGIQRPNDYDKENSPVLTTSDIRTLKQHERVRHSRSDNTSLFQRITFSRLTQAPDLSGLSYTEGIETLQEVARTFSGEVGFCYLEMQDGSREWVRGSFSSGLTMPAFSDECIKELDSRDTVARLQSLTHVHTHPMQTTEYGELLRVPPSLLDILLAQNVTHVFRDTSAFTGTLSFVVVEHDRIWTYSHSGHWDDTIDTQALVRDVVALEQIYLCEAYMRPSACTHITAQDRASAIERLLAHYTRIGATVREQRIESTI